MKKKIDITPEIKTFMLSIPLSISCAILRIKLILPQWSNPDGLTRLIPQIFQLSQVGIKRWRLALSHRKYLTPGTITGEYADVNGLELASKQFSQLLGDNFFFKSQHFSFYFKSVDLLYMNTVLLKSYLKSLILFLKY